MSLFGPTSRYVLHSGVTQAIDRRGRVVACVLPARIPQVANLGIHRRLDGQRLDHLAERYLSDPTAFWRIARHNDAMTVDQLADAALIAIPVRGA
jgi:hypothetical protein